MKWQVLVLFYVKNFKFNIDELYLKKYPLNYNSDFFGSVLSKKLNEGKKVLDMFNHDRII